MRPDDVQGWMFKLADAASGEPSNFVFVMRQVLTAAYRQGFEDGHMAAGRDAFVKGEIERKAEEKEAAGGE